MSNIPSLAVELPGLCVRTSSLIPKNVKRKGSIRQTDSSHLNTVRGNDRMNSLERKPSAIEELKPELSGLLSNALSEYTRESDSDSEEDALVEAIADEYDPLADPYADLRGLLQEIGKRLPTTTLNNQLIVNATTLCNRFKKRFAVKAQLVMNHERDLKQTRRDLQEQESNASDLQSQVDDLGTEIVAMKTSEEGKLETMSNMIKAERAFYEEKLQEADSTTEEAMEELRKEMQYSLQALKKDFQNEDFSKLADQIVSLEETVRKLELNLKKACQATETLEKQAKADEAEKQLFAKSNCEALQQVVAKYQKKVSRLEHELTSQKQKIESLLDSQSEKRDVHQGDDTDISQYENNAEVRKLSTRLAAAEKEKESLKRLLAISKRSVSRVEDSIVSLPVDTHNVYCQTDVVLSLPVTSTTTATTSVRKLSRTPAVVQQTSPTTKVTPSDSKRQHPRRGFQFRNNLRLTRFHTWWRLILLNKIQSISEKNKAPEQVKTDCKNEKLKVKSPPPPRRSHVTCEKLPETLSVSSSGIVNTLSTQVVVLSDLIKNKLRMKHFTVDDVLPKPDHTPKEKLYFVNRIISSMISVFEVSAKLAYLRGRAAFSTIADKLKLARLNRKLELPKIPSRLRDFFERQQKHMQRKKELTEKIRRDVKSQQTVLNYTENITHLQESLDKINKQLESQLLESHNVDREELNLATEVSRIVLEENGGKAWNFAPDVKGYSKGKKVSKKRAKQKLPLVCFQAETPDHPTLVLPPAGFIMRWNPVYAAVGGFGTTASAVLTQKAKKSLAIQGPAVQQSYHTYTPSISQSIRLSKKLKMINYRESSNNKKQFLDSIALTSESTGRQLVPIV